MDLEEIKNEIKLCSEDPKHFINNYVKISHPMRGIIPFDMYRFQERLIDELHEDRFTLIKKFRQAGITTLCAAYSLWYIIFNEHKNVMVVSIGDRESRAFLERLVNMYDDLPPWLRPKEKSRNKHELCLSTGSRVKSQPAGAGRGESVSLLMVDEAAFIDKMREFWMAIFPTISTGGKACIISTVNGMSNLYYEMYDQAQRGESAFKIIDIAWEEHPEYTDEWAETMRPTIGERAWLQEYECEFLGTGDTFVDGGTLKRIRDNCSDNYQSQHNNTLRVWKDPVPHHTYAISVDSSFGREFDYSAAHVINLYNGEQVAEFYSNKITISKFAKILCDLGRKYNAAHMMCERNGLGIALIEQLFDVQEYENMWCDEKGEMGMQINQKTREVVLNSLQEKLKMSKIHINSERSFKELATFIINENGKLAADTGYNDDLVMSLALGCYLIDNVMAGSPIAILTNEEEVDKEDHYNIIIKSTYNDDYDEDTRWVLGK
tara:strand:+ start:2339 stop:3811 length:1473 start_codon:yes stop_codon:yes gene_type:complete